MRVRAVSGAVVTTVAALACAGIIFSAASVGGALTVAPSSQDQRKMADLAKAAMGTDAEAAMQAIRDLKALGDPAKPRLMGVVRERLTRDKAAIEGAIKRIGDPAKAKAAQDELMALRKSAVGNIAKLAKDETLRIARENYDKLAQMMAVMNEAYAVRETICSSITRRAELLVIWREVGPPTDTRFSPANEDKLRASAEAALGLSVADMQAIPALGQGKEPSDPTPWNLWFYRTCRRIEAYNNTLRTLASPEEWENITLLNAYRESLGTMPLEVDARILQSARRHSKEMADKGYFAHESPTPSEKTHALRMKNAGYASGYSENIADGTGSGSGAFWMWFGSPPHHQNMVHAGSTAMGAGKWGSKWTQNFGTGKRLMLLPQDDRAKSAVLGTLVPPQGSPAALPARAAGMVTLLRDHA